MHIWRLVSVACSSTSAKLKDRRTVASWPIKEFGIVVYMWVRSALPLAASFDCCASPFHKYLGSKMHTTNITDVKQLLWSHSHQSQRRQAPNGRSGLNDRAIVGEDGPNDLLISTCPFNRLERHLPVHISDVGDDVKAAVATDTDWKVERLDVCFTSASISRYRLGTQQYHELTPAT